jgi:hydrogenase expression/formation protein HypC
MCLAVPLKILSIQDSVAAVDLYGAKKDVSLLLLPEAADVGDYVLVHAGFALRKLDEEEAEETLELMREMAQGLEQEEIDDLPANNKHR